MSTINLTDGHQVITITEAGTVIAVYTRSAFAPVSPSTDNAVPRFNGAVGHLQNSGVLIDDSNNVTGVGTVDGRDIATDGTKLDGIEAAADVTDATNVAAAGAVMDADFVAKGDLLQGAVGGGSGEVLAIGTTGQVPTVQATGVLAYATPAAGGGGSSLTVGVRKASAGTVAAMQPVVAVGYNVGGWITVEAADAASAATMPALGLSDTAITNAVTVDLTVVGLIEDIDTSAWDEGDALFVASGGGITTTKPNDPTARQKLAVVTRDHASGGSVIVAGALRSNDVPGLPEGQLWLGDSSGDAAVQNAGEASVIDIARGQKGLSDLMWTGIRPNTSVTSAYYELGFNEVTTGNETYKIIDGTYYRKHWVSAPSGIARVREDSDFCKLSGYGILRAVIAPTDNISDGPVYFGIFGGAVNWEATNASPNQQGIYIRYLPGTDTKWRGCGQTSTAVDGSTVTTTAESTVTVAVDTPVELVIDLRDTANGNADFYVIDPANGTAEKLSLSSGVPAQTVGIDEMNCGFQLPSGGGSAAGVGVAAIDIWRKVGVP